MFDSYSVVLKTFWGVFKECQIICCSDRLFLFSFLPVIKNMSFVVKSGLLCLLHHLSVSLSLSPSFLIEFVGRIKWENACKALSMVLSICMPTVNNSFLTYFFSTKSSTRVLIPVN